MVLVVDDERVFVDTFAMILNQSGYYPLMAYSGEQALALIEEVRPDLVFADIVMGWVNGVDVAMALKRRWPDCPVLLTSGHYENLKLLEPAEPAGYQFEVLWRPMAQTIFSQKSRRRLPVQLLDNSVDGRWWQTIRVILADAFQFGTRLKEFFQSPFVF